MYYCTNCKKYIKQGNVCDTCGKQMTAKDGIIFCPKCNKSFFNPGMGKKFTCQNCNTQIEVNEDFLMKQKGKTDVNKVDVKNQDKDNIVDSFNKIMNEDKVKDNMLVGKEKGNEASDTEIKFPHNYNNNKLESGDNNKRELAKNDDSSIEINEDLFEDATDSKGQGKSKNKKDKKANKKDKKVNETEDKVKTKSGNTLSFIAISLIFVLSLIGILYYIVFPLLVPSYKANWDKYISAENDTYEVQGIDHKVNTVEFKVEDESAEQIIALVKVEDKVYNEVEEKYNNEFISLRVIFIKKNGKFVIQTIENVE